MATFNKAVGQTVVATATETNAGGKPLTIIPANLAWSIDDPTVAELIVSPEGFAVITGLTVGTVNVTVKDTVFNLSDSGSGAFTADLTPTSIAITFA